MELDRTVASQLNRLIDGRPSSIQPMSGATSSDLFLLQYPDRRLVLRLFKQDRWDTSAESLTQRELTILTALTETNTPTPEPIAAIPGNGVVMSWLEGAVVLPKQPEQGWIDELASWLSQIHQSSIEVPYQYESWNDVRGLSAPSWWQDAGLWSAAQEIVRHEPPYVPGFVHRDYHPVNVLWSGTRITGVVDWINACMGPVGIDIAHCRSNLAVMYGQTFADDFLCAYQELNRDYEHDPFWDIDDALGALPDVEPYPPWAEFGLTGLTTSIVQQRLRGFVDSAVKVRLAK